MTSRTPYKKRLREHLKETRAATRLERRIKQLGGKAEAVRPSRARRRLRRRREGDRRREEGRRAAQGPLHAIRGTGDAEKLLKNAKTEL